MTFVNSSRLAENPRARPGLIAGWALFCAFMILCMCLIGAVTRLTESGLSITEWKPIMGVFPPQTDVQWGAEFKLYKSTPEYKIKNMGMEIGEFKRIYFWEWFHRFWGRMIGIVYAVPLLVFWWKRWIPPGYFVPLMCLLALGGAQGFVGWFMVQSGLIDRPAVSHYRLALHLTLALMLYAFLIWCALSIRPETRPIMDMSGRRPGWLLRVHTLFALLMVIGTIIWGAFVAGLDAGLIYNEFPTMGAGHLIPTEMWHHHPFYINLFENHAAVQFVHRWVAMMTVLVVLSLTAHALLMDVQGRAFSALSIVVLVQAGLGITTLVSGVDIKLAVMHQAGAVILLGLMVVALHGVFRSPSRRIDKINEGRP